MATFTIRLPDDLHQHVKRIAALEDRSMNAELVHLLKRAVAEYERGRTKEP
ncbi:Arc family DNA-binding protein [Glycomyces sp. NPDC049804]|uniref:FitA-like ribbon-helix-helix domain-containing protein n=1 Tax=Glycomyces sp. NPDC049804 TaxID=3154363 RepID=UPI00342AFC52